MAPSGAVSANAPKPLTIAERFRGFLPVVVDVECGGFNAKTDAILEIAAVLLDFDGNHLQRKDTHFYRVVPFPGAKLEEAALKFTGINPYHPLRIAYPEVDVFRELFGKIRNAMKAAACHRAILVGHNAHFDHGFVSAAAERHSLKRNPFHPFSNLDTASMAALCFGQTVLARAVEAAGLPFDNASAHSARYDAEITADLFCHMINRWQALGGWPPPGGLSAASAGDDDAVDSTEAE
ncbi:MAG: ribonuclease T [Pseudomonadales bacterium]|nr:ribonuclease T [Pseudomonadales bacterium]